jgi:hydroxymethylbilane synthase
MWQARHVREQLQAHHQGLAVDIIGVRTEADRFLNLSLEQMGGKGAFIKELEQALLAGTADLAVHSMKDVTIDLPPQLSLPVILRREDARDVLISNTSAELDQLPAHARVGTSSLRRQCQLHALRPDLDLIDIRGNVGTRLKKLDAGDYDALVLAAAGVKRLGMQDRIKKYLATDELLPAIGQGALGLEIRAGDQDLFEIISVLNDAETHACVLAERSLNRELNGGCHAPVAAHAVLRGQTLTLRAIVGRLDGTDLIRVSGSAPASRAEALGTGLGQELLARGAGEILRTAGRGAEN